MDSSQELIRLRVGFSKDSFDDSSGHFHINSPQLYGLHDPPLLKKQEELDGE